MIRALWSAATGMNAQELRTSVISNNLANVNTTGFKQSEASFQDLMYQTYLVAGAINPGGGQVPTGIQLGMGTKTTGVKKIFTQGDYTQTDNQLDMSIEGDGFFRIQHNDEEVYTRAGNFTLDSEGYITTDAGDRLLPEIAIPVEATTISLQPNGKLTIYGSKQEVLNEEDIDIATFINPAGLYALGGGLFRVTEGSGPARVGTPGLEGRGTVSNRTLEMSNVSIVDEMVSMIVGQRAYEANSKSIQTADSMLSLANSLKR